MSTYRRTLSATAALAAAAGLVPAHASAATPPAVRSIAVAYEPFSAPGLDGYVVGGRIPQLQDRSASATNRAITAAFAAYEKSFATSARRHPVTPTSGPGHFEVDKVVTSASSTVTSSLMRLETLFPGGNDGEVFTSFTTLVPSGRSVALRQLFSHPAQEWAPLAAIAARKAVTTSSCLRPLDSDPADISLPFSEKTFAHWSLTPAGLALGFDNGELGASACGAIGLSIPWRELSSTLSPLGHTLVSATRGSATYRRPA